MLLVKVASTATVGCLLGLTRDELINALSLAFVDGQALRTYRHAPNTGSRKSWAAGDATSRAVRLALIAKTGEMGYPRAHRENLGLLRRVVRRQAVPLPAPIRHLRDGERAVCSYPAEFHAQTAVEAAMTLHARLAAAGRTADEIRRVTVRTHAAAMRIIDKQGPLANPADRDHCIQYMIAVPLLFGRLTAADYEDAVAADPRIDALRAKIACVEDPQFTQDYHDPAKRSIANALTIEFDDGSTLAEVAVEYPIGHMRRRAEGWRS